jgi:hypothetical protein
MMLDCALEVRASRQCEEAALRAQSPLVDLQGLHRAIESSGQGLQAPGFGTFRYQRPVYGRRATLNEKILPACILIV